jgi:hypothetical protein
MDYEGAKVVIRKRNDDENVKVTIWMMRERK